MKYIQNFISTLNEKLKTLSEGKIENEISENGLNFKLALVYDSVMLYTSAIAEMGLEESANFTCDSGETWTFGSTVINYVRTVSY